MANWLSTRVRAIRLAIWRFRFRKQLAVERESMNNGIFDQVHGRGLQPPF